MRNLRKREERKMYTKEDTAPICRDSYPGKNRKKRVSFRKASDGWN
ncbi:hypothetical protein CRE_20490 [Caenorhabditis remanei]|uniref:Uncharacterized protein n=1 Tax=Caenorhabditis remanei TaxID=31234 RepID=E3N2U9_CAERE|nr:hypothetical protein CRE_20490 [Caenorhabditis remanei]